MAERTPASPGAADRESVDSKERSTATACAHGPELEGSNPPLAPPICTASTFAFDSMNALNRCYEEQEGWIYTRYDNPTVVHAERHLALLEGAERSVLFGSGMAAISTAMLTLLRSGSTVLAQQGVYGGTDVLLHGIVPELGIDVRRVGFDALATLTPDHLAGVDLLYLESPNNPLLRVLDLERISEVAREAGVVTMVDATFGPPVMQQPYVRGIDLVVHSVTKYLGGHSDLTGGAVSGSTELAGRVAERRKQLGGILDPFSAFLLQRGMRSLDVRMKRHAENAQRIAEFLAGHPRVADVIYPGLSTHPDHALAQRTLGSFGGMVSFRPTGGLDAAVQLHDSVRLFTRGGSLGGCESLLSLPSTMSHRGVDKAEREALGITDDLIRLSIGIEDARDLIEDLETAIGS